MLHKAIPNSPVWPALSCCTYAHNWSPPHWEHQLGARTQAITDCLTVACLRESALCLMVRGSKAFTTEALCRSVQACGCSGAGWQPLEKKHTIMCTHTQCTHSCAHTPTCAHTHMYTHTHTFVCTHMCTHIYIHVYTHTCSCAHILTHVLTHVYTLIHMRTHSHTFCKEHLCSGFPSLTASLSSVRQGSPWLCPEWPTSN